MPATPEDIAAGTREAVIVAWSNAAIQARYPSARDGSGQPSAGYFDRSEDAQTVMNDRAALIGVERWRFAVTIGDIVWPDPRFGLPTRRLIDSEQAVDRAALVSRIALDLDDETTSEELFG
ncbi:MAG: hypothetical protein QHC65_16275 [Sphingomonas sp.]|nr:hypothetical protein [Sphingomonas sp.]MDX3885981.1 hypothetical protein [Sphingomonas sp.]